ncbi:MAG: 4Fe4S-binding leucine-rich repeat protein, partial [Bradyrhizobium sp.]|nr:4Fe4S-binding leucine-rich repeat protein [Bradyrhizobium sp.]
MSDDIDEAIDWQGHEISCAGCAHEQLSAAGGCRLRHARGSDGRHSDRPG